MSELPSGWATCHLSDVLDDLQAGFASGKKNVEEGLPHLRMNNISIDGKLNLNLIRTVPRSLANQNHYLRKGDVLVCTTNSGTLVGKCALFDIDGEFAFSNHLTRLRAKPHGLDSNFLHHQLWLLWKNGEFERKCKHWVNQSTLPKDELLSTEIVVPPINEQRRILAKLEKLLSRVNAAQQRLATIPHILQRFRQSVLAAACSGKLTVDWRESRGQGTSNGFPPEWSSTTLGRIADIVDPNPSHRYPSYEDGSVPILSTQEFSGLNDWDTSTAKLVPTSFFDERSRANGFFEDDIVFARKGRLGLARRPPKIPRYTFSHTIFLVRANGKAMSEFLLWYLRQETCVTWLLHEMNSNTGVPTLGKAFLSQLPVVVPPTEEQQEIVRRVEALFNTADALEARYRTAKAHVDKLTQSVLAKAFRGELVPQDPNDEPASALLERIGQDKAAQEKARKKATCSDVR